MGYAKITTANILTFLLFAITLTFLVTALATGYPFGIIYEETAQISAFFRIAVSLLMLLRLFRSFPALPLIFGQERSRSPNFFFPEGIYYFKILLCFFLLLGLFTDIVAALLFLSFVLVFANSRYFSIEEIYFQNTLFHLLFLGCGRAISIDSILELPSLSESGIMFNSFFLSNGLIMLSAGYEKLNSKLWTSGKGTSYFFNSPHLLKKEYHFLNKMTGFTMVVLSFMVVFCEFFLLFSCTHPIFLLIVLIVLLGFSISLFTVIDISFIGQILTINLLFFLALNLLFWEKINPAILLNVSVLKIMPPIVLISASILFFTLITTLYYPIAKKLKINKIQKFLTGTISPIGVFTESHQYGFYIFRIMDKDKNILLDAFDENGYPGTYQMMYPRYFQAAMYPVTDYCLAINNYGPETKHKLPLVIDLLYAAFVSKQAVRQTSLTLMVKKFEEGDNIRTFTERQWSEIGSCNFSENGNPDWTLTQTPPIIEKTSRLV